MNIKHKTKKVQAGLAECFLILVLMFAIPWPAISQDVGGDKESFHLQIWDSVFPIIFEDKNLNVKIKQNIVNDIQSMYGHPTHRLYSPYYPQSLTINGKPLQIVRFRPYDGLDIRLKTFYRIFSLGNRNGTEYIEIPTNLSDFYQQAFARKRENATAYAQLENFINYLNDVENIDFPGWKNVYYFYGGSKRYSEKTIQSPIPEPLKSYRSKVRDQPLLHARVFQERYSPYTCRILSILHVQKGMPPEYVENLGLRKIRAPFEYNNAKSKLIARATCLDKKGRVRFFNYLTYDNGRWKIWFDSWNYPKRKGNKEEVGPPTLKDFAHKPHHLKIVDTEYSLLFEDTRLSKKQRHIIVADLENIIGQPKHRILFGNLKPYDKAWGRHMGGHFNLVMVEDAEYLLIQKSISDTYKKSFKLLKDNPKALTHLKAFIDYINHYKERKWVDLENLALPYFARPEFEQDWHEAKKKGKKILNNFLQDGKRHLVYPSLLVLSSVRDEFSNSEMAGFGDPPPKLLASLDLMDNKNRYVSNWNFCYHKNRWKILIPFGGE